MIVSDKPASESEVYGIPFVIKNNIDGIFMQAR
jgi:hypothetical protein